MRLPASFTVSARFGRSTFELVTRNISLEGLFLDSARPAGLHHLVHVAATLPAVGTKAGDPVHLRGIVTRSVTGNGGRRGGMGIHFYGLGVSTRSRWLSFFEQTQGELLGSQGPRAPIPPQFKRSGWATRTDDMPPTPTPIPVGRPTPSPIPTLASPPVLLYASSLSLDDLNRLLSTSLTTHRIEVTSDELRFEGLDLPPLAVLALVHPTSGAELHIPARLETSGRQESVSLELIGVTQRTRQEFEGFIELAEPPPTADQLGPAELEAVLYEASSEVPTDRDLGSSDIIRVRL